MSRRSETIVQGNEALGVFKDMTSSTTEIETIPSPARRQQSIENMIEYKQRPSRGERSSTFGAIATGALVSVVGTGLVAATVFGLGVGKDILGLKQEATVGGGKAVIETVDMDIAPITLSTAKTKVTGVKAESSVSALGGIVKLNATSVTRAAYVEQYVKLDPKKLKFSYNDKTEELKIIVPDTATLTTEAGIETGDAKNTDESAGLTNIPEAFYTYVTKLLANKFANNKSSDVPWLNKVSDHSMSVQTMLENISDLYMEKEVAAKCGELIPGIDGYETELAKNVKEVSKGVLMDTDPTNIAGKAAMNGLGALQDKPFGEVQKIFDNATVVMPDKLELGQDTKHSEQLANYMKSDMLTVTGDDFTCAVSKDATLTRDGETVEGTK